MIWVVVRAIGVNGAWHPAAAFSTEAKAAEWQTEWQRHADEQGTREVFRTSKVPLDPTGWV